MRFRDARKPAPTVAPPPPAAPPEAVTVGEPSYSVPTPVHDTEPGVLLRRIGSRFLVVEVEVRGNAIVRERPVRDPANLGLASSRLYDATQAIVERARR